MKTLLWIFIILVVCNKMTDCKANSTSDVFIALKHLMISRQASSSLRYSLDQTCCTAWTTNKSGKCSLANLEEWSEESGRDKVRKVLYELAVNEGGRVCKCGNKDCVNLGLGPPCRDTQFQCGTDIGKSFCIENRKVCDSNNDCGNWEDEQDGCKIKDGYKVELNVIQLVAYNATSKYSTTYGASKAEDTNGGYFASKERDVPVHWWKEYKDGPVAINYIYFEEKYNGSTFEFWGCNKPSLLPSNPPSVIDMFGCTGGKKILVTGTRDQLIKMDAGNDRYYDIYGLTATKLGQSDYTSLQKLSFVPKEMVELELKNGGATSVWAVWFDAQKAFTERNYWYPKKGTKLPQTIYNKFSQKVQVSRFLVQGGKTEQYFPRKFTFFGTNAEDCANQEKWGFQITIEEPIYDSESIFRKEIYNPNMFSCYGIRVERADHDTYTAIKRIRMYGPVFFASEDMFGASSIFSSKNDAKKAMDGTGGYFCAQKDVFPVHWWKKFKDGPVAINSIYFEEKYEGCTFQFWGCNGLILPNNDFKCFGVKNIFMNGSRDQLVNKDTKNNRHYNIYGLSAIKLGTKSYASLQKLQFIPKAEAMFGASSTYSAKNDAKKAMDITGGYFSAKKNVDPVHWWKIFNGPVVINSIYFEEKYKGCTFQFWGCNGQIKDSECSGEKKIFMNGSRDQLVTMDADNNRHYNIYGLTIKLGKKNYASLQKLQFIPKVSLFGASSIKSFEFDAEKAMAVSGSYFCAEENVFPVHWWKMFKYGPVAINSIYFEEKFKGCTFEFWGCNGLILPNNFKCIGVKKIFMAGSRDELINKNLTNFIHYNIYGLTATKLGPSNYATLQNLLFISNASKASGSTGVEKYYGNVMVGGRPVCDQGWNAKDAKVVCNELGFGDDVTGIMTEKSAFGSAGDDFRISKVDCPADYNKLRECNYVTNHEGCNEGHAAGVYCINSKKLTLRGGKEAREGNVYIQNMPVCDNLWNETSAQVVCNGLYGEKDFKERQNQVPVWKATTNSVFGPDSGDKFIMEKVECSGKERLLTDCKFNPKEIECPGKGVAGVQCAICTIPQLKAIVREINIGKSYEESRDNFANALKKLESTCHPWDCTVTAPTYPEYCLVWGALRNAAYVMQKPAVPRQLSLKFNAGKLLSHQFTKGQSNALLAKIDQLQDQNENFQSELANYFGNLADFDAKKAKADFKYASTLWVGQREGVNKLLEKMKPDLGEMFTNAFISQGSEIAYKAGQLALTVVTMMQPVTAVFNPAKLAGNVAKIAEVTSQLADSTVKMAELGFTFLNTLPAYGTLAAEIGKNVERNKNLYAKLKTLVGIDKTDYKNKEEAMEFLDVYNTYEPAISAGQMSRFQSLIDRIVGNICTVIGAPGGIFKAAVRMMVVGKCPKLKREVKLLKDLLAAYRGMERKVLDIYADSARAKLSQSSAADLSNVQGRTSTSVIEGVIARKMAQVLFQLQKTTLINYACDRIKYTFYGEEIDDCKELRKNPFGDMGNLISFQYDTNLQCPDKFTRFENLEIPAMVKREGSEEIPAGTLDLSALYNSSEYENSVNFQIPNVQWLADNNWIKPNEVNQKNFFLKTIQIYPLPTDLISGSSDRTVRVETRLDLLTNNLDGEEYVFDEPVSATFGYKENDHLCDSAREVKNLYTIRNCPTFPKVCVSSKGDFSGPIYPSLLSLWKVTFAIPQKHKRFAPFPVDGRLRVKVRAEICLGKSQNGRRMDEAKTGKACCSTNNEYAGPNGCAACPQKSVPRLFGYFCELCPKGYSSWDESDARTGLYGCRPCPINTYSENGDGACKTCPSGQSTDGLNGASMCA